MARGPWGIVAVAITATVLLCPPPGLVGPMPSVHGPRIVDRPGPLSVPGRPAGTETTRASPLAPGGSALRVAPADWGSLRWYNATAGLGVADEFGGLAAPPPLRGAASATDPFDGSVLIFGGIEANGSYSDLTWLYRPDRACACGNGTWSEFPDDPWGPPASAYGAMDFDRSLGVFLLVGGVQAGGGDLLGPWGFSNYSYEWFNYTTTDCLPTCPAPRSNASMTYVADPADVSTVLFGGCLTGCGTRLNDTWEFQLSSLWFGWAQLSGASPSPRTGAAFDYVGDSSSGEALLFGGTVRGGSVSSETWSFEGGIWTNHSHDWDWGPPARSSGLASVDPSADAWVITGGLGPRGEIEDTTWALPLEPFGPWENWTSTAGAAGRTEAVVGGAAGTGEPMIFGGVDSAGAVLNSTWVLQNATEIRLVEGGNRAEIDAPTRLGGSLSGGANDLGAGDALELLWSMRAPDGLVLRGVGAHPPIPTVLGNWTVDVIGYDRYGVSATAVWPLRVVAPGLFASVTPNVTDVDLPVHFFSEMTGLVDGPVTTTWAFGDELSTIASNCTHAYAFPGYYFAFVAAGDSAGNYLSEQFILQINPLPKLGPVEPTLVVPWGSPANLSVDVSGGSLPYNASWEFGDGSPPVPGVAASHLYSRPGSYVALFSLTDAAGAVASQSVLVHVVRPFVVEATSSARSTVTGNALGFSANYSGGTPPFEISWLFGDGAHAAGAEVAHAFGRPGTFAARVWVNDSLSNSTNATVLVYVAPAPSFPAPGPRAADPFVLALILGLPAAALALIAGRELRRARQRTLSADLPPEGYGLAGEPRPADSDRSDL